MLSSIFAMIPVFANDSTGYVRIGGIEYLKNKNIAVYSEDLWISKKLIKETQHQAHIIRLDALLYFSVSSIVLTLSAQKSAFSSSISTPKPCS